MNTMDNIIVTNLGGGYLRLQASDGYRLYSVAASRYVSEAIVKESEITAFRAEPIAAATPKRKKK